MTTRDRLPLLALLWLLTAAGAGLLFAWLLWPAAGGETGVRRAEGPGPAAVPDPLPRSRPPLPLPGPSPSGPGSAGAGPAGTAPLPGTAPPTPPAGLPPAPPPSILVTVLGPDGAPVENGVVYALGAGEAGSDDEYRVSHAYVEEPGPVRLRVPVAGVYDLGYRDDTGATLLRDLSIAPGDGNGATLRIAPGVPVQVRVEGEWPPPGAVEPLLTVWFWTEDAPRQVEYPGRGERGWAGGNAVLAEATGFSTPLQPGRTYRVGLQVQEVRRFYEAPTGELQRGRARLDSVRFSALPDRESVRPGETLVVRTVVRGALALSPGLPPSPAGEGKRGRQRPLVVEVLREGVPVNSLTLALAPLPAGRVQPAILLPVDPGSVEVRWSGQGLRAGSRAGIAVRGGEFVEVAIPLEEDPDGVAAAPQAPPAGDPGEVPSPNPLEASVEGIPPGRYAVLYGALPDEEEGEEEWMEEVDPSEEGPLLLEEEWRRVPEAAAIVPPYLASDFVPVPATGTLGLSLKPAGLLLAAQTEVLDVEEFGFFRLRRTDGRPIPVLEDGGQEYSLSLLEVEVEPGTLLGPFPEGTITFEVRLGGIRLPDAKAVVRAGRIEVLRLSR